MDKWVGRRTDASTARTEFLLGNPKRIKLRALSLKIFDDDKDNNYKM